MNNPARELHSLLGGWSVASNASVYSSRGAQNAANPKLWDDVLRAVSLLDEVRAGLKTVDLLEANRKMLDSIAATIFVPDAPWSSQGSGKRPSAEQMGSLASWALILDRGAPQFTLEKADIDAVRQAIGEAKGVLASVPGMSEPHRTHIGELLDAALAHLSGDRPDLLAARSTFHEAVGVLAFQPTVKRSSAGREFLRKIAFVGGVFFFSQVGVPVMNGIASDMGSEFLLEQFSIHQEVDASTDLDAEEPKDGGE